MKVFVRNFNGILDLVKKHYEDSGELAENPHEADVLLTWQDVRGDEKELAEIFKDQEKPVIVVQHGRGATRDYLPPNDFTPLADKFCVWGEAEKRRLIKKVPEGKIEVVGCPLISRLKPKIKRDFINILFTPVITQKEEPENILVYAALKLWETKNLIENTIEKFSRLKQNWLCQNDNVRDYVLPDGTVEQRLWKREVSGNIPRNITYQRGLVNVKITGTHDMFQYQSPLILTNTSSPDHIDSLVEVLRNTDLVVCLEEGTLQLLASALDIPVILVDIFNYVNYGGAANYDSIEKICTDAVYRIDDLKKLEYSIEKSLTSKMTEARIKVVEEEGGAHLGNANANIIKVVDSFKR